MTTLRSTARNVHGFAGALLFAGLGGAASLTGGEPGAATTLPSTVVPQSCGMQLKADCCSAENLEEIRGLGFRFVRRGFIWADVEKERGVCDFSGYDRLLEDARQRGLRVLGCIAFDSKLYGPVREPAGREAYARFAAALAARYKEHHVIWEIWNEPNTMTFWGKHGKGNSEQYAAEYTALVKEVAPAMRKADPGCFIAAGSVSCLWPPSYNWTENCFKQGILQSGVDAWSVHPYGFKSPEEYVEAYAKVRRMMAQHNAPKDFPLLNSERGYPLKKAEGWAGGPESEAPQYQAWHFVRQYLVDLLCDVRLTNWYEWTGEEFGIVRGKDRRPAYEACRAMMAQLDGYRLAKRMPTDAPADFVLLFEKESGEQRLVAWTSPPANQSPDRAKAHAVEIPAGAAGPLEVYDLYGKKSLVSVVDGKISLTLSGSPQYVVLQGKAAALPAPPK